MPQSGQGGAPIRASPVPSQTEGSQDLLLDFEGEGSTRDSEAALQSSGTASGRVDDGGITEVCRADVTCRGRSGLAEDGSTLAGPTSTAAVESHFQEVLSLASKMLQNKYSIHQSTIQVESALNKEVACDGCNTELPPPEWWLLCCNWGGGHHH